MTKADIVAKISEKLGLEKGDVQATVESFMEEVKKIPNYARLLNTFRTEGCYSHPKVTKANVTPATDSYYFTKPDSLWGDAVFNSDSTDTKK